jgi:hypothetical protein
MLVVMEVIAYLPSNFYFFKFFVRRSIPRGKRWENREAQAATGL